MSSATFIYLLQHFWSVWRSQMVSFSVTSNTQHRIKPELFSTLFPIAAETWRRFLLTGAIKWQYKQALFSRSPHSIHAWTWMRVQRRHQRDTLALNKPHCGKQHHSKYCLRFPLRPPNACWKILLICIDIYAFAKITRDWLKKTRSMIETEIHHQHKQVN